MRISNHRRPIAIMDEAHNAGTRVSFDSLARFGPSFVLELKNEGMIKLALKALDQYARPMRVPRLTVEQAGRWSPLEPVEFAWNLDALHAGLSEVEFESDIRVGSALRLGCIRPRTASNVMLVAQIAR